MTHVPSRSILRFRGRRVPALPLLLESAGFVLIAVTIWLDELIDLPHRLFGASISPFRPEEAILESSLVLLLGATIVIFTAILLRRHIDRLIVVCAWCHRVRLDTNWLRIEEFLQHHHSETSHGMCPECAARMDAELDQMGNQAA